MIKLAKKLIFEGGIEELTDAFEILRSEEPQMNGEGLWTEPKYKEVHALNRELRKVCGNLVRQGDGQAVDLYKKSLLWDAKNDFDAFLLYMEWNRPYEKKFYEPRREKLRFVVDALQKLADGDYDMVGVSLPPGVGKSTVEMFYMVWMGGRFPELSILMGSYNSAFLKGAYNETIRMIDPEGEYLFNDVFPESRMVETDAKNMMIDLQSPKRFATFEYASVGSGKAGRVRASNMLICDDLVDGIETAMSKERLDKLWQEFTTDLRQRMIGGCKMLMIGTRWSLYDPIGRLEVMNKDNKRALFIKGGAVDSDGESLWDYPMKLGFSTEFYKEQKDIMDDASWRALYMNEPVEREGQLYAPDELRYYYELPQGDADAVIAVVDSKEQGKDYCVMPVAYRYGDDYYIDSVICDDAKPEILTARIIDRITERGIQSVQVEANRGGTLFADNIAKEVKGICTVSTKWNQANKETRILVGSAWVKERCLFRAESERDKEYRLMMGFLTGYTMSGRNKHDDVPDALSQLYDFVRSKHRGIAELRKRMW